MNVAEVLFTWLQFVKHFNEFVCLSELFILIIFQHIGCDYVINSNAKEDHCGVCRGDGSTCETIKDQYNETQGLGKSWDF